MPAPNTRLRDLRRARGLTQQRLTDLIQVSRDTERGWEHGRIGRPGVRQIKALADVLDVPMDQLGFNAVNPAVIEPINLAREPFTSSVMSRALTVLCDDEQVQRRSFTLLTGTALMEPVAQYLAAPPSDLSEHRGGRAPVTNDLIDNLDAVNAWLRVMDDRMGGESLLRVSRGHLGLVHDLLDHGQYTEQIGRRLHGTMAELLRTTGWQSFDVGRYAQAQQLWVTALRAAHLAGDHALAANILGWMSDGATQIDSDNAVPLAQAALAAYRGKDPKVMAILQLQAAKAYGYSHDLNACRRAIDAAFDSFSKANADETTSDWRYWICEQQIHARAAGFSYYAMGKWSQAEHHLEIALEMNKANLVRDNTLCYTMLAITQLHRRDMEQACSSAHKAIDLLGGWIKSAQCTKHLHRFTRKLDPYRSSPIARDFIERMRSLTVVAA